MSRRRSTQIVVHEGHEPDPLRDLRDADVLVGEDTAEIDFAAFEADRPHRVTVIVKKVGELIKSPVDARRSRVEVGGEFQP